MEDLPEEILEVVFCYLSPYREYDTASLVCKKWNSVVKRMLKQLTTNFSSALQSGVTEWCCIEQDNQITSVSPRVGQSTCYNDFTRSLYLFGGKSASRANAGFNDLLKFDLHTFKWHRPQIKGAIPPPKFGASLQSYKHFLILFGGSSLPPTNTLGRGHAEYSNELHVYDTRKETWTLKSFLENECPPPLCFPCSCVLEDEDDPQLDSMFVYGGYRMSADNSRSTEIWCLNLHLFKWERHYVKGDLPSAVNSHSSMWMCRLQTKSYSNALFLLNYNLSCYQAWKLLRTSFIDWISVKVDFQPSPNGYVPTMCTLHGQTCALIDGMVAILANPGTPHIMPLMHEIKKFKLLKKNEMSKSSQSQLSTLKKPSDDCAINNFLCVFLLDLKDIETNNVVQWIDQLQDGKLKPCFIGRLTSSNIHAVLGRGEIVLHGVLKHGNSISMGLYNVRQAFS